MSVQPYRLRRTRRRQRSDDDARATWPTHDVFPLHSFCAPSECSIVLQAHQPNIADGLNSNGISFHTSYLAWENILYGSHLRMAFKALSSMAKTPDERSSTSPCLSASVPSGLRRMVSKTLRSRLSIRSGGV